MSHDTSRREFFKYAGTSAAMAGLAGCQSLIAGDNGGDVQTEQTEVPDEPIKIGVLAGQSGLIAVPGTAGLNATELWADKVNEQGGIVGRDVELVVEEETLDTEEDVNTFRKLATEDNVDLIVGGISTGTGQEWGSLAEDLEQLWIAWDSTTQSGLEETLENPTYAFRSPFNEIEAVSAGLATAKKFPDLDTIGVINNDYSYGYNTRDAFLMVLNHFIDGGVESVVDLYTGLGQTDFSSEIDTLISEDPDLVFCSFWGGDAPILLRQGTGQGLWEDREAAFSTAGGVFPSLSKEFTPEGTLVGYNSYYPYWSDAWTYNHRFLQEYSNYSDNPPVYEADHAWFAVQAYKQAVENAFNLLGRWPEQEEVATALQGVSAPCPSGMRSMRPDNYMQGNYFMGEASHDNPFDFITVENVVSNPPTNTMRHKSTGLLDLTPPDITFGDWIDSWTDPEGL